MSKIENASIIKAANVYFDGKVTSRTIELADGSTQSLGIMQVGEYRFDTNAAEIMEMMSGDIEVKQENETEFTKLTTPCSFNVPANSYFDIKAKSLTDYCCSYL